jgi:hypothetical protein
MRYVLGFAVVLITSQTALADGRCTLAVEMRGAVVEGTLRRPIEASDHSSLETLALPDGGRLVSLELRGQAVPVSLAFASQKITDAQVLGADPALALAITDDRVEVIVQPGAASTLVARWTAAATITNGELQVTLPAHAADECSGMFHAVGGPGAGVVRARVDAAVTRGASASFVLGPHPITLAAELSLARPAVWVQDEPMGGGITARATTTIAPRSDALAHVRRAVLVIDTSKSMNLVGAARVAKLAKAIAGALPSDARFEAITFARTPARVFGAWRSIDTKVLEGLDAAVRTADNGSDLGAALALARDALGEGVKEPSLVIVITDGVLGEVDPDALAKAVGDGHVHAIAVDPTGMTSPGAKALTALAARTGGAFTEIGVDDLEASPPDLASWLAPAWQVGSDLVRAGDGTVTLELTKTPKPAAHGPTTPLVGQLALMHTPDAALFARHPYLDDNHAFAVLATAGRVAASRRTVIAGGGPYTRMIADDDPYDVIGPSFPRQVPLRPGVIDREVLQRLFDLQLQPRAYRCFQRAQIPGTVRFAIELGRGEVTHVAIGGGGDPALDACLLDAAYGMTAPLIDPRVDPDDRTIANYPLTFEMRADKTFVVAGDADSNSPLDIDAIKPWVVKPKDAATPLGPLRP